MMGVYDPWASECLDDEHTEAEAACMASVERLLLTPPNLRTVEQLNRLLDLIELAAFDDGGPRGEA
jgi:hypothetical protein